MKSLKERLEQKIEINCDKMCEEDDGTDRISYKDGAASLVPLVVELQNKLNEIRWSWENDAGRNCDNLAHEALQSIEKFLEGE